MRALINGNAPNTFSLPSEQRENYLIVTRQLSVLSFIERLISDALSPLHNSTGQYFLMDVLGETPG